MAVTTTAPTQVYTPTVNYGAFGTAMLDTIGANICDWVTGASGGIVNLSSWSSQLRTDATNALNNAATAQTTANNAMAVATGKPSLTQIPIGSDLWKSINSGEDSTFPRASLSFGSASGTSSGGSSTASPHTHPLSSVPEYQPAGNGTDPIEIGYIRCSHNRQYTTVGFITGDSATWAGITGAYLGVYYVNPSTGALTLLNTGSATTNLSGSISSTNTQQNFSMGYTINANQGDIFAVGLLQVTSALQTCAALMCTTLTTLDAPSSATIPQANYCYVPNKTSLPATIAASSLNYSASTKLPFYYLS